MKKENPPNNGADENHTETKKVSMNLTFHDIENSIFLKDKLHVRNQASVVSRSMSILSSLIKIMEEDPDSRLLLKNSSGKIEEIRILGII